MHSFPRSSLLILQNNAISSLIPSTLIDQVAELLDSHRIEDAAVLVDQRRRKLEGNLTVDPDEAEELEYVYQIIGFKCFGETLFEDAGKNLFNGALDPRVLVSYYPDLSGDLFSPDDQVDVYSGVAERMPEEKNIDDLIRNYSPHLSPNTREAPPAIELRRVLGEAAREMLLVFLEKSRRRARVEKREEDIRSEVTRVVDTVLAKLYAYFNRHDNLRMLLSESNNVVLPEIESPLRVLGLLSPLANLYKQRGEEEKLIELYAGCVEGTYQDTDIQNPLEDMVALLESRRDKNRTQQVKWGLWMLRKGDVDRGLKLLIPAEMPRRRDRDRDKEDDLVLLEQITEANAEAGRRFLEYLVLTKRNMSSDLHTRLALACVDDLLQCLKDESISKLWRAKASSYASTRPTAHSHLSRTSPSPSPSPSVPSSSTQQPSQSRSPIQLPSPPIFSRSPSRRPHHQQPFLSYFASTTPDSVSKRVRLKAVFMLSGSAVYDAKAVQERLFTGLGLPRPDTELHHEQVLEEVTGETRESEEVTGETRESEEVTGETRESEEVTGETRESEEVTGETRESEVTGETRELEGVQGKEQKGGNLNVLALECAILDGKLAKHTAALSTLVHELRDSTSAEVYCTLGGEVVPAKVALSIAESTADFSSPSPWLGLGLKEWYFGLFEPPPLPSGRGKRGGPSGVTGPQVAVGLEAPAMVRQKSVKEDVKRALLRDLLGVYMCDVAESATRLLDSQGVNLDVVDWPLSSLETFLARYFRRTLHDYHENLILKNLSAGQNLTTLACAWEVIREQGCVIEEPDSEDEKAAHVQAEEIADKLAAGGEKMPSPSPSLLVGDEKALGVLGLVLNEPVEAEREGNEGPGEGEGEGEDGGEGEGEDGGEGEREDENGSGSDDVDGES